MIVIDTETTGIDPYRHGIISIGAVNFKYPDRYFYGEGRPSASVEISQGALDINGYTRESLKELPKAMVEVLAEFYEWLGEQPKDTPMIMAGHNVSFDMYFLLCEHDRCGLKKNLNPFKHRTIDLHTVAQMHYILKKGFQYPKDMPENKIQEKLGLPVEPSPHYALNGAVWEAECLSRLLFNRILFTDFEQYPLIDNPWS